MFAIIGRDEKERERFQILFVLFVDFELRDLSQPGWWLVDLQHTKLCEVGNEEASSKLDFLQNRLGQTASGKDSSMLACLLTQTNKHQYIREINQSIGHFWFLDVLFKVPNERGLLRISKRIA